MRNKTIRRLPTIAREIAHLQNEVKSIDRKLASRIKRIAELEKQMSITKFHATEVLLPIALADYIDRLELLNPAVIFKLVSIP